MKTINILKSVAALSVSALMLSSCYVRINDKVYSNMFVDLSGKTFTDTYALDSLTNITVGVGDVNFIQSEECRIEITADEVYKDYITFDQENDEVAIHCNLARTEGVKTTVYAPYLETFMLRGSGTLEFVTPYTSEEPLGLSLEGSGQITLGMMEVSHLGLTLAGSGDILSRSLTVDDLEIALAGSGDVTLQGVTADEITAEIAGSGDIAISGSAESVDASVAGSGTINLRDLQCEKVSSAVAGSGKIRRR